MSTVRWHSRPRLDRPVMVAAFEGWNDAGEAASGAARWLVDQLDATLVGVIDCEEFFDFTATRPMITRNDAGERAIEWPDIEIWTASLPDGRDVVFVVGQEPQLRWRTFCSTFVDLVSELDVSLVVSLGALLSDVPHTRPSVVSGTTDDPAMALDLDLVPSTYEGPTGIVGVVSSALRASQVPTASLWASVPTYVSGAPSPKATLALVDRTGELLGYDPPTTDLEVAAATYVRQLDDLVAADDETAVYVAGLEEATDADEETFAFDLGDEISDDAPDLSEVDADDLVREVERFLRGD